MDFIQQLEYPLPILKVLAEKIVIETSGTETGALLVDNIGGGLLSGRVTSNIPALKFSQQTFSGNQVSLDYTCNTDGCKPGDVIQSEIVVMSNGGEKSIPLLIKVVPASIYTSEDIKLTSRKDFLAYAKRYPAEARRLFTSAEFLAWLIGIGYEYMDIYDHLVKDANKERALENFFILSKLKNRATLFVDRKTHYINAGPEQKDFIIGEIVVHKTGWGYVEADVSVSDGGSWLAASPERLTAAMFNAEDQAIVRYAIDTAKLQKKMTRALVRISGVADVSVVVTKKGYITASADKSCYESDESGLLHIVNHCGRDLTLDITVREGFVKFEGRRYFMGESADIPFTVKLNALQLAQIGLKRQPYFDNEIYITTQVGAKIVKRSVRVSATSAKR